MMTIVDPEQFTNKDKPIPYIKAFVELYNRRNRGQVYEIYGIVEIEKMHALTAKHPRNLSAHCIVKILSILRNAFIVSRDQERIVFYINNYIDWDQFN